MTAGDFDEFNNQLLMWVIVIACGGVFAGLRDFLYGISSEKIGLSIRSRFFESIVRKDVGFYDERKVGDILSRLTSDTQIVQMGLTTNVAMFLKSVFVIIAVYVILFLYSWKNTLIAFGFLVPLLAVMTIWARLTQFTQKQYQEIKAEASSHANETLGNVKTVKAFAGEMVGVDVFNVSNNGVFNVGKNMACYYATFMCLLQLVNGGFFVGIGYFSADSVKNGELTPGEVAAYMLYNWQIVWNIMGLNTNLQQVAKVQGAFYEIAVLVTTPKSQLGYYDKKEVTSAMTTKAETEGKIELTNVAFNYPTKPDVTVLKRINIDVQTNKTVALVGHSGKLYFHS